MNKIFWDHLTHFDELIDELKKMPFSSEEQAELIELIDSTFHHHILEEILSSLPQDEHDRFMSMLSQKPDDQEILVYLIRFVPDMEAKIANRSHQVRDILRHEIRQAQKHHRGRKS